MDDHGRRWAYVFGPLRCGHLQKSIPPAPKAREQNIPVDQVGANSDFEIIACFKFRSFFQSFKPDVVIGYQNKDWRLESLALKLIGSGAKVYSRQGLQLLKNSWWYRWIIKLLSDGSRISFCIYQFKWGE